MKILHLEHHRYPEEALARLTKLGELVCLDEKDTTRIHSHLQENQYDVVFTRLGIMLDQGILSSQKALKYIVSPTTGLNHIDLNYCDQSGISVISLKGEADFLSLVKSTAEHTWMLILTLLRNFPASFESVKKGQWNREPFLAEELNGNTIGIIGYGRLGKIIAGYAGAFGMEVLVHDHDPLKYNSGDPYTFLDLNTLLEQADIIVLMISYSPENINFIGADEFGRMKKGSFFINTARGELVDENALLKALKNGPIQAAAIDVMKDDSAWSDSVDLDNPLIEYARNGGRLLVTPHMGGYGRRSIEMTRMFVTDKLLKGIVNS